MAGNPKYHVNVIKLKCEITWTGGLPHLSGLPHLPGASHLHVNRPLVFQHLDTTLYSWRFKNLLNIQRAAGTILNFEHFSYGFYVLSRLTAVNALTVKDCNFVERRCSAKSLEMF